MKLGAAILAIALALDQTNWLGSLEWMAGVVIVLIGYALVFRGIRRRGASPAATDGAPQSSKDVGVVADG